MDLKSRFKKIQQILFYILFLNLGVASLKLICGWLIHSASMTADGFHSLSDGFSNIMGLFGIWIASRPIDETHPYGHKKFETITSMGISILLFLVCLNIIREGVTRFLHPIVPKVSLYSFIVMSITIIINIIVMVYETHKGKVLKSDILISDALHTKTDILTSSLVIITLIGVKFGYPILDPIVSLLIVFFIGYSAVEILIENIRVLSDGMAIPIEEIKKVVLSIQGIKQCHQIRSRGRPDDIHIDLHVLVDPVMNLSKAHQISYMIENEIKKSFQGVTDVVVHIEPLEEDNGRK